MGKVELELLEWRTEGPDKPGVYNATVRPGFEQADLGGVAQFLFVHKGLDTS